MLDEPVASNVEAAPADIGVRVGWATEQVMAVLRDADGPLSAADIRSAVSSRTGRAVNHSTVRYILRHGRWAKRGDIKTESSGRYCLDRQLLSDGVPG